MIPGYGQLWWCVCVCGGGGGGGGGGVAGFSISGGSTINESENGNVQ